MSDYDVIVIGAGPAGYHAAIRASQLGLRTAVIDKWIDKQGEPAFGGTCLNVGCIPSKALLEASHKFVDARDNFTDIGIKIQKIEADVPAIVSKKEQVVANLTKGVAGLLKGNGVATYDGAAKLYAGRRVVISAHDGSVHDLEAKNVILAS